MRVSRGADEGTAGPRFGGAAGGAILMPGETTTLTEGLRAAAGARSKTKALHRILAARWRPRPLYVLHACPADVFTAYDDLDNFYSSVSSCLATPSHPS